MRNAEFDEQIEFVSAVFTEVAERGLGKGKGGRGTMACPKCGEPLYFSVASINGHVWAKCSADGCVGFMQ